MRPRILRLILALALVSAPLVSPRAEEPSVGKSCAALADFAASEIKMARRTHVSEFRAHHLAQVNTVLQMMMLNGCRADPAMAPRIAELSALVVALNDR